jgi:hypothetical protein
MRRNYKNMHLTARTRSGETEKESQSLLSNPLSLDDSRDSTPTHSNGDNNSKSFRRHAAYGHSSMLIAVRRLNYQCALMSIGSRIASCFVAFFLTMYIVLGTMDNLFHQFGDPSLFSAKLPVVESSSFAVAINTFKRPDMLREAVQHYASTCGKRYGVSQVFVIWAEQGATVPTPDSLFDNPAHFRNGGRALDKSNRANVIVLQKAKDSLNSRFEPIAQLTSPAVFMVDDDVRVACPSLASGFRAWNAHPNSMVGYYPRLASAPLANPDSLTELIYHTWPVVFWKHKFNLVLTKASFLHSKYLGLYSGNTFPQEIKDLVDQHKNCEDVAMSMLVANYTSWQQKSNNKGGSSSMSSSPAMPIFVEGSIHDRGLFGGISTQQGGHMSTRSDCLTELTAILQRRGWPAPLSYQVPLRDYSWLRHAPGFWWQFRPSNFFEWFSFGNTRT